MDFNVSTYRYKLNGNIVSGMRFIVQDADTDNGRDIFNWIESFKKHHAEIHTLGGRTLELRILTDYATFRVLKGDYVIDFGADGIIPQSPIMFESLYEEIVEVEESNLVAHARREFEIAGEEEVTIEAALKVVQAFADMGHSGASAVFFTDAFTKLFSYGVLTPVTNDPDEWEHVAEETWGEPGGIWQNKRASTCFSNDGGKTFYDIDEDPERDEDGNRILHTAIDKK